MIVKEKGGNRFKIKRYNGDYEPSQHAVVMRSAGIEKSVPINKNNIKVNMII